MAHPGMAVCMCLGSDTRGRITSNETTRTEKDSGYPGAVSQTEVSGFKGNSNSVECTTKADGRRERETGNCFVQTAGGSATDPAVSGTRKTNFKGVGRAVVGRTEKIQGTIPADGNKQDGRGEIVESLEPAVEEKTVENTTT